MELRAHALKLRYWPEKKPTDDAGRLLDLDWAWIKSLKGDGVAELRIHGPIGGRENIRLIFFVRKKQTGAGHPIIWLLDVKQKKRQPFTKHDLAVFKARRQLVFLFYGGAT